MRLKSLNRIPRAAATAVTQRSRRNARAKDFSLRSAMRLTGKNRTYWNPADRKKPLRRSCRRSLELACDMAAAAARARPYLHLGYARILNPTAPLDRMFPADYPPPQQSRVDSQSVADGGEAERVGARRVAHDPALGVNIETPGLSQPRMRSFLIDVYSVSQQRQHQALFAGQAMAAGNVIVLARQD